MALVRLHKAGKRFEIACYRNKVRHEACTKLLAARALEAPQPCLLVALEMCVAEQTSITLDQTSADWVLCSGSSCRSR